MLSAPRPLTVYNRHAGQLQTEWMAGHRITYLTHPELSPYHWLITHPIVDRAVALYQNSHASARDIEPFVKQYDVDMSPFEPHAYRSFSDFFLRRFRAGARTFTEDATRMPAFVEARYFGWTCFNQNERLPIKGKTLKPRDVLESEEYAKPFCDGPVLVARLAPVDYHHIHYPDDGKTMTAYRLGYRNNTVNWRAMQNKPSIVCENERQVSLLDTDHFGKLAFVEVGAVTVGKVVQSHDESRPYKRGMHKGFFRFGGSLIVVFGELGRWAPTPDILEHTSQHVETLVRLGEPVALTL